MNRLALLLAALCLLVPVAASAQTADTPVATPGPVSPESWAGQLDTLLRWADHQRAGRQCTERCFALQRLRLTGSLSPGPIQFELEGAVLADGAVAVPLFGPPDKVRIEGVTENGAPAAVSFDDAGYFLHTSARRFVLRGAITLQNDLALTVIGPLNSLDAALTGARVVEGPSLAGLRNTTLHFDRGAAERPAAGPTVFQLSHAVRVGREIAFTDKLVMRSGTDLGVVRLPLRFGQRVLDVTGSAGWRVDGAELLLPTSGREAEITVSGTLPQVTAFTPDPRSEYEWWLLESDAEHRITVGGDARQLDSAESPIARTQPSARLFLVQRGHRIEPVVQTLTSVEALAAVVHAHDRTVVLTRQGDLVADDTLRYENNGIDYLLFDPHARPIFLATDGTAERIMHRGDAAEILVPLRTGSHTARVQSLSNTALSPFAGTLTLAMPTHPLTTSRVSVTLGLPAGVRPLAVLGGDCATYALDGDDLAAFVVALAAALLALRTARRRALGFVALSGAWLVAPGLYVGALCVMAAVGALWLAQRLLTGALRTLARVGLAGAALLALLVAGAATMGGMARHRDERVAAPTSAMLDEGGTGGRRESGAYGSVIGNVLAQNAQGGVLQGVTPVALTLPAYERAVTLTRELVTRERPFTPRVVYVTTWATAPLEALWLACVLALAWSHRRELEALRERLKARLAQGEAAEPPKA